MGDGCVEVGEQVVLVGEALQRPHRVQHPEVFGPRALEQHG
jgi:hypothetical protein